MLVTPGCLLRGRDASLMPVYSPMALGGIPTKHPLDSGFRYTHGEAHGDARTLGQVGRHSLELARQDLA